MIRNSPSNCPICSDSKCCFKYQKASYFIYKCANCSVHFVHPQPSKNEILAIYDADYFKRGNKYNRYSTNRIIERQEVVNELKNLQKIKKYKSYGKLLDCGCATGKFLYAAKKEGFDISGLEVSTSAAESASNLLKIEIENCELMQSIHKQGSLDVITLWDVIEHVQNPLMVLNMANSLLKSDGILAFSTGDISSLWAKVTGKYWQLLTPPQHLFFYNQKSIKEILELSRFELLECNYIGKQVKVEFLLFKMIEAFGRIGNMAKAAYEISGMKGKYISMNLQDIMTCVAKKS